MGLEEHRAEHGFGRELVRRAQELARESGAEWLHVDFEPGLQKYYRECGFRESRAGLFDLRGADENRTTPCT